MSFIDFFIHICYYLLERKSVGKAVKRMKKTLSILLAFVYVISAVCTVAGFYLFFDKDSQMKEYENKVSICQNMQKAVEANDYDAFYQAYKQADKSGIDIKYTDENNFTKNDINFLFEAYSQKTDIAKSKRFACVLISFSGIFLICSISLVLIVNALINAKEKEKQY